MPGQIEQYTSLSHLWRFIVRNRISLTELGIIASLVALLSYVAFAYDLFTNEGRVSVAKAMIELDEALLIGVALLVGFLVFAVRRYHEQKREMLWRQNAERRARELAYQDPLTGLPNRRQFDEALDIAVASPPPAGAVHAVLMLDLNGFKQVNDVYGHDAGDAVLMIVAQRLCQSLREDETIARLGGDEFVVLARHLLGPEAASSIAMRLLESLANPIMVNGVAHNLSAGVGIALLPLDAATAEEAMRKADVALYRAKAERRAAYRFFEEEMDQIIREREQLEKDLKLALDQDQIQPSFRPSRDLRTGAVVGFEVEPQWLCTQGEPLPPERFLPIAAETGLIHTLAMQVWHRACTQALQWPAQVALAISVLPGQMQNPRLAAEILQMLDNTGLAPQRLQMNIAENMVVQDLAAAKALVAPLQAHGVAIVLNHFGTGYSNLYHLSEFHFDQVKIDRRLVERMDQESSAKLVRALVGLGQGLGLKVCADGIAHDDSDSLLDAGVQEGQSGDVSVSGQATLSLVQPAGDEKLPHA